MCFQFEGQAGEEFQEQASQLCSQHSQAVELIKNKKRKDPRFAQIIQVHTHTHTLLGVFWLYEQVTRFCYWLRSARPVLTAGGCS